MSSSRRPANGREFWVRHINQWCDSGLTQVEYCTRHDLGIKCFYNWKYKLLKRELPDVIANSAARIDHQPKLLPLTIVDDEVSFGAHLASNNSGSGELRHSRSDTFCQIKSRLLHISNGHAPDQKMLCLSEGHNATRVDASMQAQLADCPLDRIVRCS